MFEIRQIMNIKMLYNAKLYWIVAALLVGCSCGSPRNEATSVKASPKNEQLLLNSIPAKRLLAYWDDFNFKTGALSMNPENAEQSLVDFIALLPTVPDTIAGVGVHRMLKKASIDEKSFDFFIEKYAHYLYDPNSPMRNEDFYEHVLTYLIADKKVPEEERTRYTMLLELVRKNQVGSEATDFEYLGEDGESYTMQEGTKPYKMLVFYDPTCSHCEAIMQDLAKTPAVNNCIENGFLDIVSISLHPDKEVWESYQKRVPDNWTNGWDEKGRIINEGLYNIRAYPTIFLLNQSNMVLLKDAPLEVTLRYLVNVVGRS